MRLLIFPFATLIAGSVIAQQSDPASRVYEQVSKSVFLIVIRNAQGGPIARGTGFLVADNRIVTDQHVVRDGSPFLDLGAIKLPLKIEKVDSINDLAILTVDGELSVSPLALSVGEPAPGTSVFAIENPAGLEKSISSGVVAGVRQMFGRELIQISAPISPGSSGGPILNSKAQVIAVAVGILQEGQNLNFAVPAKLVQKLLSSTPDDTNVPALLSRVDEIYTGRNNVEFSIEPDSPWMKRQREMEGLLRQSLALARNNASDLAAVADKILRNFWTGDPIIAVDASERLVQIRPTTESYTLLARSLQIAAAHEPPADKDSHRKRAERAIRSAFVNSKQPTFEMYAVLADILEAMERTAESKAAFLKAYEMAKAQNNASEIPSALRGLIRTSAAMSNYAENNRWFRILVDSGFVSPLDRDTHARLLHARGNDKGAGDEFALAASASWWDEYCDAATAYSLDNKQPDRVLLMARACVANGANKKDSEGQLARAHRQIATVLNTRGVYEEALSHAREAVTLQPQEAFYQETLADALIRLRRFQEAINAAKQAIRLSDGKYSWMHFTLGTAYFEIENWELSRQSFEKAAQLNPKDAAAAYNVAICLVRLGMSRDAAPWYKESLKRDPSQANRQDILSRIQSLRR